MQPGVRLTPTGHAVQPKNVGTDHCGGQGPRLDRTNSAGSSVRCALDSSLAQGKACLATWRNEQPVTEFAGDDGRGRVVVVA